MYLVLSIWCLCFVWLGVVCLFVVLLLCCWMRFVLLFLCVGCIDVCECEVMFDGGMWGLVRLLGIGCVRCEN